MSCWSAMAIDIVHVAVFSAISIGVLRSCELGVRSNAFAATSGQVPAIATRVVLQP